MLPRAAPFMHRGIMTLGPCPACAQNRGMEVPTMSNDPKKPIAAPDSQNAPKPEAPPSKTSKRVIDVTAQPGRVIQIIGYPIPESKRD